MPGFDLSGNFTRAMNWKQDRDNGIRILADRHDVEDDNFAGAFNQTFLRNGAVPMTGNLNMNGKKINTISAGTELLPGLTFELNVATGLYQADPNHIGISINGSKRLEVATNGSVIYGGSQVLALKAASSDHTYLAFYPRTADLLTIGGWVGYGAAPGTVHMQIANNIAAGAVSLVTRVGDGGAIELTPRTGLALAATPLGTITHGAGMFRVQSTGAVGVPTGSAGTGIELWRAGIQSYDRTANGYTSMSIDSTIVNFGGPNGVLATIGKIPSRAAAALALNGADPVINMTSSSGFAGSYEIVAGANEHLTAIGSVWATHNVPSTRGISFSIGNVSKLQIAQAGIINLVTFNNGILSKGSWRSRFEEGEGVNVGVGPGIEIIGKHSNGWSYIYAYNQTSAAFGNLSLSVALLAFQGITTTADAANLNLSPSQYVLKSTSSRKYKKDIKALATGISRDIIMALKPITYVSRGKYDSPARHYGLIAEDVAEVAPQLVSYSFKDDDMVQQNGNAPSLPREGAVPTVPDGVQYERLIVPLIKYIQELEARLQKAGI